MFFHCIFLNIHCILNTCSCWCLLFRRDSRAKNLWEMCVSQRGKHASDLICQHLSFLAFVWWCSLNVSLIVKQIPALGCFWHLRLKWWNSVWKYNLCYFEIRILDARKTTTNLNSASQSISIPLKKSQQWMFKNHIFSLSCIVYWRSKNVITPKYWETVQREKQKWNMSP